MRLGLFSTTAALLACSGLALGQVPDSAMPGQPIDMTRPMNRGLLRSGPAPMLVQAQPTPAPAPAAPTLPPAAPAAGPIPPYGSAFGGDLAGPPAVGSEPPYAVFPWQQDRAWVQGEYLL